VTGRHLGHLFPKGGTTVQNQKSCWSAALGQTPRRKRGRDTLPSESIATSRPSKDDVRQNSNISCCLTASSAFARLGGLNWFANENRVEVHGKSSSPNHSGKFCDTMSGNLECKIPDYRNYKPDYYLLECERSRWVCEGSYADALSETHRDRNADC
jgi:hypothetical protein